VDDEAFTNWVEQNGTRFPKCFVDNRLKIETRKAVSIFNSESSFFGKWINPRVLLSYGLRFSGLTKKGADNALKIQLRRNKLSISHLPEEFVGYKILQISDPHFNDHEGFIDRIVDILKQTEFDLCVFTGDYRFRSFGSSEKAISGLSKIAGIVETKMLAILGNHDSIRMVPEIEILGVTVLMNEHVVIERGDKRLLIAGVDDPRYYRTDDIALALNGAPAMNSTASILLAHSPELYQEAARVGFDAYLCGHTHGGQVCLIPGKTLFKNFRSPGWTLAGCWVHDSMSGYTSSGVGTSVVNARFNCTPEITIHELSCSNEPVSSV